MKPIMYYSLRTPSGWHYGKLLEVDARKKLAKVVSAGHKPRWVKLEDVREVQK